MICKNCGHENRPEDKFCGNCGTKLKNSDKTTDTQRLDKEDIKRSLHGRMTVPRRKRKASPILYIILGVVLSILVIWLISIRKAPKEENSQQRVRSEEKSLYQEDLAFAQKAIDKGNYEQAIKLLKEIPQSEGEAYRQGQKMIAHIEDKIVADLRAYLENKDYTTAKNLAGSYLEILPNSEEILQIKEASEKALLEEEAIRQNKENEEAKAENLDPKSPGAYDLEELRRNNSYGQDGNPLYTEIYSPEDFLGRSFTIDTDEGQVRKEPDIDSKIIEKVKSGDLVHVYDVEKSGDRYWLRIGDGWISSKLITGEFRN